MQSSGVSPLHAALFSPFNVFRVMTAQASWEWEVVSFFLAARRDGIGVGSISKVLLLQPRYWGHLHMQI